jgi:hypothetical protein
LNKRRRLLWIVLVGGAAVPASYILGFVAHPGSANALWGGIPAWLIPVYKISMLLAASGFFPFTYLSLTRIDRSVHSGLNRAPPDWIEILYVLILIPSALWLPLTNSMIQHPNKFIWSMICCVLGLVGGASIGLLLRLLSDKQVTRDWLYWTAVVGCLAFCIQTAILDAIVWTAYFIP